MKIKDTFKLKRNINDYGLLIIIMKTIDSIEGNVYENTDIYYNKFGGETQSEFVGI